MKCMQTNEKICSIKKYKPTYSVKIYSIPKNMKSNKYIFKVYFMQSLQIYSIYKYFSDWTFCIAYYVWKAKGVEYIFYVAYNVCFAYILL